MSLAGFKKQINKANQYVSEKIGGAKGTELDHDFHEMERKIDVTGKLVEELMARTHELLQPNPASRAKLSAVNTVSKFRGQAKNALYPQPEGQLGECMVKYGKELGEESALGPCLIESGEAFRQMADIKYALEDNVKQNFIEPLHHLQSQDLKQVNHHRKKMSGRRLDYDCKKRKQTKGGSNISDDDIHMAEEKFEESKNLAEVAMFNLLENDVEQMSQLLSFSEAYMNYHRQATDIMTALHETLQEKTRVEAAAQRPKREHVPMRATSSSSHLDKSPMYDNSTGNHNAFGTMDNSGYNLSPAAPQYTNTNNTTDNASLYSMDFSDSGSLNSISATTQPTKPTNAGASAWGDTSGSVWDTDYTTTTQEHQTVTTYQMHPVQQPAANRPTPAPKPSAAYGIGGSVAGSATGHVVGRSMTGSWVGGVAGSAVGSHVGRKVGQDVGNQMNQPRTQQNPQSRPAGQQVDLLADVPPHSMLAQVTQTRKTTVIRGRPQPGGGQSPCCRALYDFEPENDGELGFKEGDLITLDRKIDENWYEGTINGQSGFFPVNYVQVEVDLPNGGY